MFKNLKVLVSYAHEIYVTGINPKICCDLDTIGYHHDFYADKLHPEDPFVKMSFNRIVMEHYHTMGIDSIWAKNNSKLNPKPPWKMEIPVGQNHIRSIYVWSQTLFCEEILCHAVLETDLTGEIPGRKTKPVYELMEFWFKDVFITIRPSDGIGTLTISKMDDIRRYQRDQLKVGKNKYVYLNVFEKLISNTIGHYENDDISSLENMGMCASHHLPLGELFTRLTTLKREGKLIKDTNSLSDGSYYGTISVAGIATPFHLYTNINGFSTFEVIWNNYYIRAKSWKAGVKIIPVSEMDEKGIICMLKAVKPYLDDKIIPIKEEVVVSE